MAESSPYYESLKKKGIEVLFCYEPYDELVLMQLGTFLNRNLVSVEKEMRRNNKEDDQIIKESAGTVDGGLIQREVEELIPWLKTKLSGKVANVKVTTKLDTHPCVVTVEEMAAARHFIRTQSQQLTEENRYALLQPQLEINPK